MSQRRVSAGRKKIEIKKIVNDEALHVCFSKRRMGLFKKAADLSTLTGAEILIIVLSPAGKAFAFGSPGVDQIINCFLSNGGGSEDQSFHGTVIPELNMKFMSLEEQMLAGKNQNQKLEEKLSILAGENELSAWAMNDVDVESLGLGFAELEQLSKALENLRYRLSAAISELSAVRMGVAVAPPPLHLRMLSSFDPRAAMSIAYPQLGTMAFGPRFL